MPVDAIQPYQIIIMMVFLLLLIMALFFVRRFRGGLSKHIQRTKRMHHIEDMALSSLQRLHLVEVDGQTFMIHAGKGHAATIIEVSGTISIGIANIGETPVTLMDIESPAPKPSSTLSREKSKRPAPQTARTESSADKKGSTSNVDQIASAIAEARRRNPLLGLGK